MYNLLVADDESESRNTLCNCFPWVKLDFQVVAQANNGAEALQLSRDLPVDVILCDIKMPLLSGIDLAQELSNQKTKPVIIFLSGYRDFEFAQKAISFGVRYYLVKPARYEEIMSLFQRLKQELDARTIAADAAANPDYHTKNLDNSTFQKKIIQMVQKYIQENFKSATLDGVSKLVHLNSSYLSQLFKQKTGANFSDYLLKVKMTKAAELLLDYKLKTYTVSELVGYTNPKNFARTFKNYYGVNPREYRYAKLQSRFPHLSEQC
jgi:two-component system response regulator YesN